MPSDADADHDAAGFDAPDLAVDDVREDLALRHDLC